jgi:voltage-gated potassium channel Kch
MLVFFSFIIIIIKIKITVKYFAEELINGGTHANSVGVLAHELEIAFYARNHVSRHASHRQNQLILTII